MDVREAVRLEVPDIRGVMRVLGMCAGALWPRNRHFCGISLNVVAALESFNVDARMQCSTCIHTNACMFMQAWRLRNTLCSRAAHLVPIMSCVDPTPPCTHSCARAARARTHTHARARARAHTHTHTPPSLPPSLSLPLMLHAPAFFSLPPRSSPTSRSLFQPPPPRLSRSSLPLALRPSFSSCRDSCQKHFLPGISMLRLLREGLMMPRGKQGGRGHVVAVAKCGKRVCKRRMREQGLQCHTITPLRKCTCTSQYTWICFGICACICMTRMHIHDMQIGMP